MNSIEEFGIEQLQQLHTGKRISIEKNDTSVILVIELKKVSPYIENKVRINIAYLNKQYVFRPDTKSVYDYHIGRHILTIALRNAKLFDLCEELMCDDQFVLKAESKITVANIIDILVNDVEQNYTNYYGMCPLCSKLKTNMMVIEVCENCVPASFGLVCDSTVVDCYNKDSNLFKLLLFTSLCAIDVQNRFVPVPKYCLTGKYEDEYLKNINRSFAYYIKYVETSSADSKLAQMITKNEYMFLKHVVLSNNTRLNYYDSTKGLVRDSSIDLWNQESAVVLFTVDHPISKQKKFDADPNVVHMFHGSGVQNWYSIMRNGIKNYSGTDKMSNGQVHGPGIYLATEISMAHGYCRNSRTTDMYNIIGVVQLLNSEKYKKTNGIYVVPNEDDVLLKYIVVIKKPTAQQTNSAHSEMTQIQSYLTKELPTLIKSSVVDAVAITVKRLNKEYTELAKKIKKIHKGHDNVRITLSILENQPVNPLVEEKSDDNDTFVTTWLIKITNNDSVNIAVQYPRTFPNVPASIYIDKKLNIPMTVEIVDSEQVKMINGQPYQCMYIDPSLRHDRWRSNIKVYKVIEQMLLNIVEQ